MAQFGDNVTLVNRTRGTILSVMWDGMHYHFEPGEHPNVPLVIATAAYKQNPIHGTEDPLGDPDIIQSLVGIKGARAPFGDCDPIEQSKAGERLNRRLVMGIGGDVKPINAGGPSYFDAKLGTETINLQDDADQGAPAAAPVPSPPSRSRK